MIVRPDIHTRGLDVRSRECVTAGFASKRVYESSADARKAMRHSRAQPGATTNGPMKAYRCPSCHGWHVGHPPKGQA